MSGSIRGVRVVVARPRRQAASLTDLLARVGADVVSLPLLEIVARPDVEAELRAAMAGADALAVTSANGARLLLATIGSSMPPRALPPLLAAVGPTTAMALRAGGLTADVTADDATGDGLAEALATRLDLTRSCVVLARAAQGHPDLPTALRAAGATVREVALYDVAAVVPDPTGLECARAARVWVLTSPSTVAAALAAVGPATLAGALLVSIGPSTSAAVRDAGLEVATEASPRSDLGLLDAVVRAVRTHAHRPPPSASS